MAWGTRVRTQTEPSMGLKDPSLGLRVRISGLGTRIRVSGGLGPGDEGQTDVRPED